LWERKDDTYGSLRLAVVAEIHATDFLSSLVHEGVADFMSRFVGTSMNKEGKGPHRARFPR
jgi:hypothetical protein